MTHSRVMGGATAPDDERDSGAAGEGAEHGGVHPASAASPTIVLASGSRYRAELLAESGIAVEIDPPDVDERALDARLSDLGADGLAVELARLKADDVAPRHRGRTVVAADQVGVIETVSGRSVLLTKQADVDAAVAQLMVLSGTRHHLVNGVVVVSHSGVVSTGVDVQVVTMRAFTEAEARDYVVAFEPFDTSGSYRLEDGDELERRHGAGAALVASVSGEDPSGVLGMPMPLLRRMLADIDRL